MKYKDDSYYEVRWSSSVIFPGNLCRKFFLKYKRAQAFFDSFPMDETRSLIYHKGDNETLIDKVY